MYPEGALMVTDNLLCRGLIEPDGLMNESQVLQAKGKEVAVGLTVFIAPIVADKLPFYRGTSCQLVSWVLLFL